MGDEKKETNLTDGEIPSEPPKKEDASEKGPEEETRKAGNPRRKWYWLAVLVLIVLALLLVHHFRNKEAEEKKAAQVKPQGASITTGQSKTGDINIYVDALGTVTPTYTVTVYSQITGRVMAVHYTEGANGAEGRSSGRYRSAALPGDAEAGGRNIWSTMKGVLARPVSTCSVTRRLCQKRHSQAAAGRPGAAVVQDEGSVKADQGTVDYDQVQLAYCHIVAPIGGSVGLRLVDPGNTILQEPHRHWSSSPNCSRSRWSSTFRKTIFRAVQAQLKRRTHAGGGCFRPRRSQADRSRKADVAGQQVDTTTGTVKFRASNFPTRISRCFPTSS